jgi:hypothetical protein
VNSKVSDMIKSVYDEDDDDEKTLNDVMAPEMSDDDVITPCDVETLCDVSSVVESSNPDDGNTL